MDLDILLSQKHGIYWLMRHYMSNSYPTQCAHILCPYFALLRDNVQSLGDFLGQQRKTHKKLPPCGRKHSDHRRGESATLYFLSHSSTDLTMLVCKFCRLTSYQHVRKWVFRFPFLLLDHLSMNKVYGKSSHNSDAFMCLFDIVSDWAFILMLLFHTHLSWGVSNCTSV